MIERRRISPGWLAAAFGLFALDIALHLPITDFFDYLAKRFGFFEYDAATQWVFLSAGIAALAALWFCPPQRRPVVRSGLMGVVASMLLAKAFLLLNAIENIHYPQYALLVLVFARAGLTLETSWLVALGLGVVDEGYQHLVLPRGTPQYLDANDIVLNGIGALLGVVMVLAWSDRSSEPPVVSWRTASRLTLLALVLAALVAPPVRADFYQWTPGGRRFHLLTPFEAVMLVGALWAGVRRLAARGSQAAASGP